MSHSGEETLGHFRLSEEETDKLRQIDVGDSAPEERIRRMTTLGDDMLYRCLPAINAVFSNTRVWDEGGLVLRSIKQNGIASHLALPYSQHARHLFGYIASAGNKLAQEGMDQAVLLERLGTASGVVVGEAQFFDDANKRTARAFDGLIVGGEGGMIQGANQRRSFRPGGEAEEAILIENLQRVLHARDEFWEDGQISKQLARGRSEIDKASAHGKDAVGRESFRLRHEKLAHHLAIRVGHAIAFEVSAVLLQESYGPAAALNVLSTRGGLESLSRSSAEDILDIDRHIQRLRLKSLVNAALEGRTVYTKPSASKDDGESTVGMPLHGDTDATVPGLPCPLARAESAFLDWE
jgi:hypothetical protein